MKTRYYNLANHIFLVHSDNTIFDLMDNYEPFALTSSGEDSVAFRLTISQGSRPVYSEEWRQEEEGQEIVCGQTPDGHSVFEFIWNGITAGWLLCKNHYQDGQLLLTGQLTKSAIDNALMVQYALATADKDTALFHSATVSQSGHAYMFLGVSGTGKSTHARLWLQHIDGSELINDDNPVVRIYADGKIVVFGSPWSGKTPCYRNVSYPIGAIVTLSQAPYNKIHRLNGLQAYIPLMESISGKRWDAHIADGLHHTENTLAKQVPVWHLECLPDEAAARLCFTNVQIKD